MKYSKFTLLIITFGASLLNSMDDKISPGLNEHVPSEDSVIITKNSLLIDKSNETSAKDSREKIVKNLKLYLDKSDKKLQSSYINCGIPKWLKRYGSNLITWITTLYRKNNSQENLDIDLLIKALALLPKEEKKVKKNKNKFISRIPSKNFNSLAGEIPSDIQNIVDSVNRAVARNEKIQRKILLYGPPGTGKTSLAEAIAGELNWNFFNVISSALITKYQGSSQELISNLFEEAGKSERGSVVFIDEIDGIANEKVAEHSGEINRAIASLHNAIDSLKNSNNVICIIATNFLERIPETIKSRFGINLIGIKIPEFDKRTEILKNTLSKYLLKDDYINNLVDLTDGFSCRDFENLFTKAKDLAPKLFEYTADEITPQVKDQIKEIIKVALYRIQDKDNPGPEDLKLILRYYLSKLLLNKTFDEINNFIEAQAREVLSEMDGLSGKEIEECVKTANFLKNVELTALDLFVSIFYENPKKLPNLIKRKKILDYFLKKYNITLSDFALTERARELDGFTAKDINKLCLIFKEYNKINLSTSSTRQTLISLGASKFCAAICQTLEKKAVHFKVIENYNKNRQYVPIGSINAGINIGKQAKPEEIACNFNAGGAINLPFYWTIDHPGFSIEKIYINDKKDFRKEALLSDVGEKRVRLELLNAKSPGSYLVVGIIMYYLALKNMNVDESVINLLHSPHLAKLVFIAQISCTTLKNIILRTIDFAKDDSRNACLEADFLKALEELDFIIKGYEVLPLPDNNNEEYILLRNILNHFLQTQPMQNHSSCAII